jgi:hypothetical protein
MELSCAWPCVFSWADAWTKTAAIATKAADFLNILFLFASRPLMAGGTGSQKQERRSGGADLPCAGITLIRFYGFDLSPRPTAEAPRESVSIGPVSATGTQKYNFSDFCNFSFATSYHWKRKWYESMDLGLMAEFPGHVRAGTGRKGDQ